MITEVLVELKCVFCFHEGIFQKRYALKKCALMVLSKLEACKSKRKSAVVYLKIVCGLPGQKKKKITGLHYGMIWMNIGFASEILDISLYFAQKWSLVSSHNTLKRRRQWCSDLGCHYYARVWAVRK